MDLLDCADLFKTRENVVGEQDDAWTRIIPGLSSLKLKEDFPVSSDDEQFEPPVPPYSFNDSDNEVQEEHPVEDDRPLRCWRHFERHFDYTVERSLRPVEDYVLGRSAVFSDTGCNNHQLSQGHVTATEGVFSGCIGVALRASLSDLVVGYKLTWRDILGGYECPTEEPTTTLHYATERNFQHIFESGDPVESPWLGSVLEEVTNTLTPCISVDNTGRITSPTARGGITPNLFTPSDVEDAGAVGVAGIVCQTPKTKAPSMQGIGQPITIPQIRSNVKCPGYMRSSSEMIVFLERYGFDKFYSFLDQIFAGLEGCRAGPRYIYAMDLITAVLQLMPEFITLFIRPKLTRSIDRGRRLCYFKRLVIIVRSFLKYMGLESPLLISDMYRDASSGCFTPFYLVTGDKDLLSRQSKASMIATILLRLFTLVGLIGEKGMEWTYTSTVNATYSRKLIQRLKRFVYMPLFSMKQLHELVLPVTGMFTCASTCLFEFDYLQWVKSYLYPPPPLYMLRMEFMKVIRLCVITTGMKLHGYYNTINDALVKENGRPTGVHYEEILRRHIFLLVSGISFFLLPEFLSTCVENSEMFFGGYFTLLPHVQYSLQTLDLDVFVEKETYKLQERVLDLIKVIADGEMLSHENLLGIRGINELQSSIIRRILGLAWHYATAPRLEESDFAVKLNHVVEDCEEEECRGNCKTLSPYSSFCSIDFLDRMSLTPLSFKCELPVFEDAKCVLTTADELETKVRHQEDFVNYSRMAEKEYITISGGVSLSNPIEIICESEEESHKKSTKQDEPNALDYIDGDYTVLETCNLKCLLKRHMMWTDTSDMDALRLGVVMQSMSMLVKFLRGEEHLASPSQIGEAALGKATPMWDALVDLMSTAYVKGELPTKENAGPYALRQIFLGRPVI